MRAHAQQGVQYLVCVSVDAYSRTTGYKAAYELYKRGSDLRGPEYKKANDCVREIWRENKLLLNEYSLTAAYCSDGVSTTEASKGVLNGER